MLELLYFSAPLTDTGLEPTGEHVTVALNPAAAGAGIEIGVIAKTILEGLAAEVLR